MSRRKKAEAETRNPEVGEQTRIPVAGPLWLRQMGAATYLAVLAYPAKKDWERRDDFIEAVKAHHLKRARRSGCPANKIQKKYRAFPNKRIDQVLNRAFRRIWHWRTPAGMAGNWILMDGATFGPVVLPGKIPVRTISLRAPNYPWGAMKVIQKLAEERDQVQRDQDSAVRSLYRRVWLTTLPVLHLVMPIAELLNTPADKGGAAHEAKADPMRFISDPSWVGAALRNAELLLQYLPQRIPSFNPHKAINLLGK